MTKCLLLTESRTVFKKENREFLFKHSHICNSVDEAGWYLYGDIYDANPTSELLNGYIFSLDKRMDLNNISEISEPILVIGFEKRSMPKIFEEWYKEHFEIFDDLNKAKEFASSLCNSKELDISAFYLKDDISKESVEKVKNELTERKEYQMRTVHYEGDIIITDPCYIKAERDESNKPKWDDFFIHKSMMEYPDYDGRTSKLFSEHSEKYDEAYDKWEKENPDLHDLTCSYEDFRPIGFEYAISHSTLYGDWSCTTFNSDTKEPIGEFCADSGMVAVFLLDEVLKYNPSFDYHINKPWTTTWIKNFKGDVSFKILDKQTIIVKGIGNVNFETRQTGF